MTVTKTNVTISLTQLNDVSLDCQVFRLPFWMAWQWTAPRIMHYISFALHFICITFHLHLKIMPRQHEMHDKSQFKCHALDLHFMK